MAKQLSARYGTLKKLLHIGLIHVAKKNVYKSHLNFFMNESLLQENRMGGSEIKKSKKFRHVK